MRIAIEPFYVENNTCFERLVPRRIVWANKSRGETKTRHFRVLNRLIFSDPPSSIKIVFSVRLCGMKIAEHIFTIYFIRFYFR